MTAKPKLEYILLALFICGMAVIGVYFNVIAGPPPPVIQVATTPSPDAIARSKAWAEATEKPVLQASVVRSSEFRYTLNPEDQPTPTITPTPYPTSIQWMNQAKDSIIALQVAVVGAESNLGGTGFIVNDKGHILTNEHVMGVELTWGRLTIDIETPDREQYRYWITKHPEIDLARLVDNPAHYRTGFPDTRPLPTDLALPLGDSDTVQMGDTVVVAGYPGYSMGNLVIKRGHIIGKDAHWLEADMPVSGGFSGSPMFNAKGEVIGVATRGDDTRVIAIPINVAKDWMVP